MSTTIVDLALEGVEPGAARPGNAGMETLRRALRIRRTRIGLALVTLVVLVAFLGPIFSPHSPTAFVGVPFSPQSGGLPFGTDVLGRDVLSRFLNGGHSIILLALAATVLGVGMGAAIGLTAGYSRGFVDEVLMRAGDVVLAFPQIVLVLMLLSMVGPHLWLLVLTVAVGHAPQTARVIRGASLDVVERDYVKAVQAMGERHLRILWREILPNVSSPLMVELGLRLTYSIGLIAGVSFLGFGLQPPTADWGLMINENRVGIAAQPWGVALPIFAIALLTVGTNLVTDGIARAAIGATGKK